MSPRKAKLELTFAVREGKTYIARQLSAAPLKIWRPFDVDDGRVLVQIVNVSPGVMAGDEYRLEFVLQANAKVVIVNQSATKLHQMLEGESAKQNIRIQLENNAELEYYPGLTIPFPETQYRQQVNVRLAKAAKFAMLESWATGRIERGELYVFRKLSSRVQVKRENKPVYMDGLELAPPDLGTGILDNCSYLANGFWYWNNTAPIPESSTTDLTKLIVGQAANEVTYLRALAKDGLELKKLLQEKVNVWREGVGMGELAFSRFTS